MGKTDIFIGSIMLLFIFLVSLMTFAFPGGESLLGGLSPAFFPRVILICMLILSIIVLIKGIYTTSITNRIELKTADLKMPSLLLITTLSYVFAMILFGFCITTPFFLFGSMVMWKVKKSKALITGIGLTAVLYVFFRLFLRIPLP